MRFLATVCILFLGLILCTHCALEDHTEEYKKEGLIPDLVDTAPKQMLWMICPNEITTGFEKMTTNRFYYADYQFVGRDPQLMPYFPFAPQVRYNDKKVKFASELTPTETKDAPRVGWGLDSTSYYTLILNDPDAPSRKEPTLREFLHWLVVNIPGDDFSKGETLAQYMGPATPNGTGLHRYTFSVYHQPNKTKLTFDEKHLTNDKIDGRTNFNMRKFVEKYKLDEYVAGTMFLAQFDDYVTGVLDKLGLKF